MSIMHGPSPNNNEICSDTWAFFLKTISLTICKEERADIFLFKFLTDSSFFVYVPYGSDNRVKFNSICHLGYCISHLMYLSDASFAAF